MRARFIPFAVIVALTLAACDGGSSGGGPTGSAPATGSTGISHSVPPHPASPTVPADVPTTGPNLLKAGEKPPVMPLEATQHTPAGAVAFAKFFIQTIDWAYATTSTTYMKHYFTSACVTCKSIASGVDKAATQHHRFVGDRFNITGAAGAKPTTEHSAELSTVISFDVTSVEVVDGRGQFVDGDIALKLKNQIWLDWQAGSWIVTEMGQET